MRLARLVPRHDTIFALCLAAALAMVAALVGVGCSRPLPDLSKVPRAQFSRTVIAGGVECAAWLPLVVRASVGQEFVELALEAAQPWVDSVGMAIAVPAVGDEVSNVDIVIRPCPAERARDTFPYCNAIAQTSGVCEGGQYRQKIEVFFVGSASAFVATLEHELGHTLGAKNLGDSDGNHNTDAKSIMFRSIPIVVSKANPLRQGVTDVDAASVRAVWGLK